MINLLIFIVPSIISFYISYQAFRYRKIFWEAPTISGFKERKNKVSPKIISYFVGTLSFLTGLVLLLFTAKYVYEMI